MQQFSYDYTNGQFMHQGLNHGFFDLSETGNQAYLGFTSQWYMANNWGVNVYSGGNTIPFMHAVGPFTSTLFQYNYVTGQWQAKQSNTSSAFYNYGAPGQNARCVFDGSHFTNLWNGWDYSLTIVSGNIFDNWVNQSLALQPGFPAGPQFQYNYVSGAWMDQGVTGGLVSLGTASYQTGGFLGDGTNYNLFNGFTFTYDYLNNLGTFYNNATVPNPILGLAQFRYNYLTGQWQNQGLYGGFANLSTGPLSASFMGDGSATAHALNNGWSYKYDVTNKVGQWYNAGAGPLSNKMEFTYNYATGQWQHQGLITGLDNLGGTAPSAVFLGDGSVTPHDLGNGWAFIYDYANNLGSWYNKNAGPLLDLLQFTYNYQSGQWQHQGVIAGLNNLGAAGLTTSFLGDGSSHNLDANWSYQFTGGLGYWTNRALLLTLFNYDYSSGQWQHQGNTGGWQALGTVALSTAFLGDGTSHVLDTNWTYLFTAAGLGYWTYAGLPLQPVFDYNYANGQWQHQGSTRGWAALGSCGLSASFVGDTMWHYLGDSWSYLFNNGTGVYYTSTVGMAGLTEFAYNYAGGQWYHEGYFGGWATLGTAGTSAAFVCDGASHQLVFCPRND